MARRDYTTTTPKTKSGGGTFVGIVIGLLLGLMIAVAVAFYLNKGPKPFSDKTGAGAAKIPPKGAADNSDPNKPLYAKDAKSGEAGKGEAPAGDSRFSFYEILPGKEEVLDARKAQEVVKGSASQDPKAASKPGEGKPGETRIAAKPDEAKGASAQQYFLQAGAFGSAGDADNQKAKLALMGFEAKVESVDVEGKGTMHRVRLGPYGRLDDINRVRSTLATNGIDAALIRIKDGQK